MTNKTAQSPTVAAVLIALISICALVQTSFAQDSTAKDDLLRFIQFGFREINLPQHLGNLELESKNHGLENDIAKLEGRPDDINLAQVEIDRFLIDQNKAAITVASWFAQAWSTGNKDLQRKLFESDKAFDQANERCFLREKSDRPKTLDEAHANCAALLEIYTAVSQFHIVVSVPPPTVFRHSNTLSSTGEKLLVADEAQLRADKALRVSAKVKKALVDNDEQLIDLDHMVWLNEMGAAQTVKYNKAHPEDPMAGEADVVSVVIKTRQELARIAADTRKELLPARPRAH